MNKTIPMRRIPTLFEAILPILFLMIALTVNVSIFSDTLSGANQIALILSSAVGGIIAMRLGIGWEDLQKGMVDSISSSLTAVLILLLIGALAGTWMISGIVPAMIYYGLKILHPTIFLFAACLVCAIVSMATGSSWSTVATVGIALLGIGKALGLHEGIVAGAIISGAYFGDKMSPLSDTTNLAPVMAGTNLITHIKYMSLTTTPSMILTLVLFLFLGFFSSKEVIPSDIDGILTALESKFYISPLLFIVPITVVILIVKKVPALPALLFGTLFGGVTAMVTQSDVVAEIAAVNTLGPSDKFLNPLDFQSYIGVMKAMFGATNIKTNSETVTSLISTKGMAGMLNTVWLILCAMVFGGVMEASGFLTRISNAVVEKFAKSTGSLVSSTVFSCLLFNITVSDQYLAIVVPGKMYADTFKKRGLAPENLSRTLEDAGTVTSVLVPWNTCGATQASVLGVATMTYLPYCFFNIISPLMSIFFAYAKIKIRKLEDAETADSGKE